jgi:hypothetical protein
MPPGGDLNWLPYDGFLKLDSEPVQKLPPPPPPIIEVFSAGAGMILVWPKICSPL